MGGVRWLPLPSISGARSIGDKVNFRVWAPLATSVDVELVDSGAVKLPLRQDGLYFQGLVPAAAGDRYWYWLDGTLRRPDPASRSQPDGVQGPLWDNGRDIRVVIAQKRKIWKSCYPTELATRRDQEC